MEATVTIKGVEFDVAFDYQPYEPMTRHEPEVHSSIGSIYQITHNGTDFFEFFEGELDIVEEAIWDSFRENSENELARKEDQGERRIEELRNY